MNQQLKIAVRADRSKGVINAYFASMDETHMRLVGTLNIELADQDRSIFEEWVKFWEKAMTLAIKDISGLDVAGFQRFEANSN